MKESTNSNGAQLLLKGRLYGGLGATSFKSGLNGIPHNPPLKGFEWGLFTIASKMGLHAHNLL